MTSKLTHAISSIALAVMIATPVVASAEVVSTHTTYATTLTQIRPMPSAGEFDGSLRLTVSSNGMISGSYVSADQGGFVTVVGGVHDGQYWLDIGSDSRLHINGQVGKDGSLTGTASTAFESPAKMADSYPRTYAFVAKLQTN